jgi:hypothetical protein
LINLSKRAADELQQRRLASQALPEQGIRLGRDERGALTMAVEEPGDGDVVIRHGPHPLLIVGCELAEAMDGGFLDYGTIGTGNGAKEGFTFRHRAAQNARWGQS